MRVLGGAGVPAGAIFETMELTESPISNGAASWQTMEQPRRRPFNMPGLAGSLRRAALPDLQPPPLLDNTK